MYRFIFLFLACFFFSSAFAATGDISVDLSSSSTGVVMDTPFLVDIRVTDPNGKCGNTSTTIDLNAFLQNGAVPKTDSVDPPVTLGGLDHFNVVGQQQSTACSSVNGKSKSETIISYSLVAKNEGSFDLGPAVWSGATRKYESKKLSIQVEKATINPTPSNASFRSETKPTEIDDTSFSDRMTDESLGFLHDHTLAVYGMSLLLLTCMALIFLRNLDSKPIIASMPEKSTPSSVSLDTLDSAEHAIRVYYAQHHQIPTDSLTYSELLTLESDPKKKELLALVLRTFERMRFAGQEENIGEVRREVEMILKG